MALSEADPVLLPGGPYHVELARKKKGEKKKEKKHTQTNKRNRSSVFAGGHNHLQTHEKQ